MGEIVEEMLEGTLCKECFMPFEDDESPGYPRACKACAGDGTELACDTPVKSKPRKRGKKGRRA